MFNFNIFSNKKKEETPEQKKETPEQKKERLAKKREEAKREQEERRKKLEEKEKKKWQQIDQATGMHGKKGTLSVDGELKNEDEIRSEQYNNEQTAIENRQDRLLEETADKKQEINEPKENKGFFRWLPKFKGGSRRKYKKKKTKKRKTKKKRRRKKKKTKKKNKRRRRK